MYWPAAGRKLLYLRGATLQPLRYLPLIVSIILIAYVTTYAIVVPITVDEVWTLNQFGPRATIWGIVSMGVPVANNHILNSLAVKFTALFSEDQLSIRLPNILSFVLYLYASYKLSLVFFKNRWLQLLMLILLCLDIELLRYFGLCRGYGMSIGLMQFAIYNTAYYVLDNKQRHLHTALIAIILSAYASFTMLYASLAVFLILFIQTQRTQNTATAFKRTLPYLAILLLLCGPPVYKLKMSDELYYGGDDGFINDTLFTMLRDLATYKFADEHRDTMVIITCLLISFSIAVPVWAILRKRDKRLFLLIPVTILFICFAGTNLFFYLLNGKLTIYRTALYFYPLIVLSVCAAAAYLYPYIKRLTNFLLPVLATGLLVLFIPQLLLQTPHEFYFDDAVKDAISDMIKDRKGNKQSRFYAVWPSANAFNYYIGHRYTNELFLSGEEKMKHGEDMSKYDYLYMPDNENFVGKENFEVLNNYRNTFIVYKNKALN